MGIEVVCDATSCFCCVKRSLDISEVSIDIDAVCDATCIFSL